MTGNWSTYKQDTDGDGTWELNQSRTHNKVNEITQIAASSAHVAHDRNGNMTKTPKPDDWAAHFDLTYDAWHRLVKVADGTSTVVEHEYDGRHGRIVEKRYSSGQLDLTRHIYYNGMWQCLELRVDSSVFPQRQFVWGPRYADDLVLRDRDTSANGTLDERLYGLQDWNWGMAAVAGATGGVLERYHYDTFGVSTALAPTFGSRGTSSYDWRHRHAGRAVDPDTRLVDMRLRHYTLRLGRFLERDPIGYASDASLYRYVHNGPIGSTDPLGLAAPGAPLAGGERDGGDGTLDPRLVEKITEILEKVKDLEGLLQALKSLGITLGDAANLVGWKLITDSIKSLEEFGDSKNCKSWLEDAQKIAKEAKNKGEPWRCKSIIQRNSLSYFTQCKIDLGHKGGDVSMGALEKFAAKLLKECKEEALKCIEGKKGQRRRSR